MGKLKGILKRATALLIITAMLATSLPEGVVAYAAEKSEAEQMKEDMLSSIRDGLEKEDEALKSEYPHGIYAFANISGEIEEPNEEPLAVFLVRHGGTEGEAKVHIKLADYTAEYGKDYTVKLGSSIFAKELEKNEDSKPLLYQFSDEEDEQGDVTEESLREVYDDDTVDEIMRLVNGDTVSGNETVSGDAAADGEAAANDAASNDGAAEDDAKAAAEDTSDDKDIAANKEAASENKTAASADDTEEGEESAEKGGAVIVGLNNDGIASEEKPDDEAAVSRSPLAQLNDDVSQYTGSGIAINVDPDGFLSEKPLSEDETLSAETNAKLLDLMIPGTEGDVTFKDGEQIKTLYVYPIDNEISDGDRTFEIKIDTEQEDKISWQSGENSVSVTIHDDEPDETAILSVKDKEIEVGDNGTAEVVIERQDALYKISSVDYEITEPETGLTVTSGKTVFMPGMEKRTVRLAAGEVNARTVDALKFSLTEASGAELSEDTEAEISLTDYREAALNAATSLTASVGKQVNKDDADNPFHMTGTRYENCFDIDVLAQENVTLEHNNECGGYIEKFEDDCLHIGIPDHACGCQGAKGRALFGGKGYGQGIYPYMLESIQLDWKRDDWEVAIANRAFLDLNNDSLEDYDRNGKFIVCANADQGRTTSTINLINGQVSGIDHLDKYSEGDMNFGEYYSYTSGANDKHNLAIGCYKTSGGINGMEIWLYNIRLNFRKYEITIEDPEKIPGHNDLPGQLRFADTNSNTSTHYTYSTASFYESSAQDYAYLKGLEIYNPHTSKWEKASYFDTEKLTLELSESFFYSYLHCVDYKNGKFKIRPVYGQTTVPVKLMPDEHGGMSVEYHTYDASGTEQTHTETVSRSDTAGKTITVNVGDTLNVRTTDIAPADNTGKWEFSRYTMTPTAVNGGSDAAQHYMEYTSENAEITIANCDYTLTPVYDHTGTKVTIDVHNAPAGCGIKGNKTEYTHAEDETIRNGRIKQLDATVASGYRAKWTILTKAHEDYGTVVYGDTFYYKIEAPDNQIRLEFESDSNCAYTQILGKVGTHDGSIMNPPKRSETGDWLSAYVPVENVTVQMGSYTGLSGSDGSFLIYSHSEAGDIEGENETTYLKLPKGTEKHAFLVTRNGVQQVIYADVTRQGNSGKGENSDAPDTASTAQVTVDFYGSGPIPVKFQTLLGTEDASDDPSTLTDAASVELRNYSIGFHTELGAVKAYDGSEDTTGTDLVDRVKFTIFHKDGSQGKSYEVKRTKSGQTDYDFIRHETKDKDGKDTTMNLNGLIDFQDGDQVYVEIIGSVSDKYGNPADFSYGMYRSGVTFREVPGEGFAIELPDISAAGGSIPAMDVVGDMIPSIKFGRFSVNVDYVADYDGTGDSLSVTVGFNVAQLNASLYNSEDSKRAKAAAAAKSNMDAANEKAETAKKNYDYALEQYNEANVPGGDPDELEFWSSVADEADSQYKEYSREAEAYKTEYENYGGTTEPIPQTDPLSPVKTNAGSQIDVNAEVTAKEIGDPAKATENKFSDGELQPGEVNPFSKVVQDKIKQLKAEAKDKGIGQPKGESFQGKGQISANLSFDLGVSMRFKIQTVAETGKGEWCFDYAMVYGSVAGGVTGVYYMIFPDFPIPFYAGASFTGSVGLYSGLTTQKTAQIPIDKFSKGSYDEDAVLVDGMVPVMLGIEGFVGMGLRNLIACELGLGVVQKFNFAWVGGYNNEDSHQTGTGMTSMYGYLGVNVLFFNYKWKFVQVNWSYTLYNEWLEAMSMPDNVALTELSVSEAPAVHYYGGSSEPRLMSTLKWTGTTKVADGLSDTASEVVSLGDGAYLAAFEGTLADTDRAEGITDANYDVNNRAVYLTYYDGSTPTTAILQKDGTNDMSLSVEDLGDSILISWASANKTFEKSDLYDGDEIKETALAEVLSSMDMYAVVLKKSEVEGFVGLSASEKLDKIERLTDDKEAAEGNEQIKAALASGASYLGYGYENGRAAKIGDQIYLFYTAVDYNHWVGTEEVKDLSDIVDADGYELYRIYDTKTGKWLESYADESVGAAFAKRGLVRGERLADIHLTNTGDMSPMLPSIGELDCETVSVNGEERLLLSYLIEGDQQTSDDRETAQKLLFLATVKPAVVSDGKVTSEPEWSVPVQVNTEYSAMYRPTLERVDGKLYLVFSEGNDLKYMNLSQLFTKITEESTNSSYQVLTPKTINLSGGKTATAYTLLDGVDIDASTAIRGSASTDEYGSGDNGFSCRNGYRMATDGSHLYVVWAQTEGNSQKLYISAMSIVDGQEYWSDPKAMDWDTSSDRVYLGSPSIATGADGNMLIAHNSYDLELVTEKDSTGTERAAGKKHTNDRFNLTKQKAVGSASVESLELDNRYPRAGETFTATGEVANDGFMPAEEITVTTQIYKRAKDGTETAVTGDGAVATETLKDRLPASSKTVTAGLTMKQDYIDDATENGSSYFVRMSAYEKGYEDEISVTDADILIGTDFNFSGTFAEPFLTEEGKTRYFVRTRIRNNGNVPASAMGYSMAISNENRFATSSAGFDGGSRLKAGISESAMKEALRYGGQTVAANKDYKDWLPMNSFLMGDEEETDTLDIGEERVIRLITAQIPDACFSESGLIDLAIVARDKTYESNDAVEARGAKTLSAAKAEKKASSLSLRYGSENAESIVMMQRETGKLRPVILPLRNALGHTVEYESSDSSIVSVAADGTLTANDEGTATITAKLDDGTKAECTVAVADVSAPARDVITVTGLSDGFTYTGEAIRPGQKGEPSLDVYYGTKKLTINTDYTLSYKNNTNAASAYVEKAPQVTVNLKGNYQGSKTFNFAINARSITDDAVSALNVSALVKTKKVSGKTEYVEQKMLPSLMHGAKTLKYKTDYDLEWADTTKGAYASPGSWAIKVKGKNNYSGETTVYEVLREKGALLPLSKAKAVMTGKVSIYNPANSQAQEPEYKLTLKTGGKTVTLEEGTDYSVTYSNNVKTGKAAVTFTALEGSEYCYGSKKASFTIKKVKQDMSDSSTISMYLTLDSSGAVPYAKGGAKPAVRVVDSRYASGSGVLTEGVDYKVSYSRNKAVTADGTAEKKLPVATVKGIGDYKGKLSKTFKITTQDISKLEEGLIIDDFTYNGKAEGYKKARITLTDLDGKKLSGKDYAVSEWKLTEGDGKSGNTVEVTLSAKSKADKGSGCYTGTLTGTFRIIEKSQRISSASVAYKDSSDGEYYDTKRKGFVYNGSEVSPEASNLTVTIKVKENGKTVPKELVCGTDYRIEGCTNNTKTGTAKLTIRGIGDYGGLKTVKYKILKR